jgi:CheY-like chemotaxis protein
MTMTSDSRESPVGPLPPPLVHELKTALSMIMGFAELLETREDPDTRTEAARGIVLAAARLQTTLDGLTGTPLDPHVDLDDVRTESEGHPRRRLIVIDDDPAELELLRAALPEEAFELLEIRNPQEGLERLDEVKPDLVILDWKLPGGGGAETLAELKLRNPDLPVIVLSDEGDPKQRQIATLLDADEFVTRPFNGVELLSRAEYHTTHPGA